MILSESDVTLITICSLTVVKFVVGFVVSLTWQMFVTFIIAFFQRFFRNSKGSNRFWKRIIYVTSMSQRYFTLGSTLLWKFHICSIQLLLCWSCTSIVTKRIRIMIFFFFFQLKCYIHNAFQKPLCKISLKEH